MSVRRPAHYVLVAVLALVAVTPPGVLGRPADLPSRLDDAEYWRLVEEFSEPNGFFRSDNLVSNEDAFQDVIADLERTVKRGGVYVGVGPDQNFTYIAALQPGLVFITDIRRGNLQLHLMYKAMFELSADRAEFLSRLFGRRRPIGLSAESSAEDLFAAFAMVLPSREYFDENRAAILTSLRETHRFPIDDADETGIVRVLQAFYTHGPSLSYAASGAMRTRYPSFQDLQMTSDSRGRNRAYLGSEEAFRVVKTLSERNLIVPVVGNFAGPKALRAIGRFVRARGATVTAFYVSNVEQYLFQDRVWQDFARNLAALPIDPTSTVIRACFTRCQFTGGTRSVTLLDSLSALVRDADAGHVSTYWDVLARGRPVARRALSR